MNLIPSSPSKYVSELTKIEDSFRRALALGETEKYKSVPLSRIPKLGV